MAKEQNTLNLLPVRNVMTSQFHYAINFFASWTIGLILLIGFFLSPIIMGAGLTVKVLYVFGLLALAATIFIWHRILKMRILKPVLRYKMISGIQPLYEANDLYQYIGFDLSQKKILWNSCKLKSPLLITFSNIAQMDVEFIGNSAYLRVLTKLPEHPAIKIQIPNNQYDAWEAHIPHIYR